MHCVQGTTGAELHPALDTEPLDAIVDKGQDPGTEGYSAFDATVARRDAARPRRRRGHGRRAGDRLLRQEHRARRPARGLRGARRPRGHPRRRRRARRLRARPRGAGGGGCDRGVGRRGATTRASGCSSGCARTSPTSACSTRSARCPRDRFVPARPGRGGVGQRRAADRLRARRSRSRWWWRGCASCSRSRRRARARRRHRLGLPRRRAGAARAPRVERSSATPSCRSGRRRASRPRGCENVTLAGRRRRAGHAGRALRRDQRRRRDGRSPARAGRPARRRRAAGRPGRRRRPAADLPAPGRRRASWSAPPTSACGSCRSCRLADGLSRGFGRCSRPTFAHGRPSTRTTSAVKSLEPRISAEPTP